MTVVRATTSPKKRSGSEVSHSADTLDRLAYVSFTTVAALVVGFQATTYCGSTPPGNCTSIGGLLRALDLLMSEATVSCVAKDSVLATPSVIQSSA